jgi:hypothetical protein
VKPIISTVLVLSLVYSLGHAGVEPSTELQKDIWKDTPGNTIIFSDIPNLTFKGADSGPSLIFSDDPEYLKAEGICGQETLSHETGRLYLYNVNGTYTTLKFAVVLKNLSDEPEHVILTKRGTAKPSGNYNFIGKTALLQFYESHLHNDILVPPHESALLDPNWENIKTKYDDLAHGFYEFYCPESTQVTLCGFDATKDTLKIYESLAILSTNSRNAGRGLFPHSDRKIVVDKPVDTKDGIQRLHIADGKIDPWITGTDGTNGNKPTRIGGNYGVLYTIEIPLQSSDKRDMAVLVSTPVNGCPYGGVIGTKPEHNLKPAGYFLTPADQNVYKMSTTVSLAGIYRTGKKPETIILEYSPPGASCLPVDLILVPVKK